MHRFSFTLEGSATKQGHGCDSIGCKQDTRTALSMCLPFTASQYTKDVRQLVTKHVFSHKRYQRLCPSNSPSPACAASQATFEGQRSWSGTGKKGNGATDSAPKIPGLCPPQSWLTAPSRVAAAGRLACAPMPSLICATMRRVLRCSSVWGMRCQIRAAMNSGRCSSDARNTRRADTWLGVCAGTQQNVSVQLYSAQFCRPCTQASNIPEHNRSRMCTRRCVSAGQLQHRVTARQGLPAGRAGNMQPGARVHGQHSTFCTAFCRRGRSRRQIRRARRAPAGRWPRSSRARPSGSLPRKQTPGLSRRARRPRRRAAAGRGHS